MLYTFICLLLLTCTDRDDIREESLTTLQDVVSAISFETGSVIACASGSENENEVVVYFYPRPGVINIRFFETETTAVDPNDFSKYVEQSVNPTGIFNGYLQAITTRYVTERWVIVSFLEDDVLQLSNPIRLKHLTSNTSFEESVEIDFATPTQPIFNWNTLSNPNDAIYFQVVSDQEQNLLSGTYTFDTQFQYYELGNVVLNITRDTPPTLMPGDTYGFTVMGVSEDNWVNFLVLQQPFIIL